MNVKMSMVKLRSFDCLPITAEMKLVIVFSINAMVILQKPFRSVIKYKIILSLFLENIDNIIWKFLC